MIEATWILVTSKKRQVSGLTDVTYSKVTVTLWMVPTRAPATTLWCVLPGARYVSLRRIRPFEDTSQTGTRVNAYSVQQSQAG